MNQQEAIAAAAEELIAAKKSVMLLLEGSEAHHLAIVAGSGLDRLINQLSLIGGVAITTNAPAHFEPVKNFMGTDVKIAEKVTEAALTPDEEKRKILKDKIDKLEAELPSLTNEQILDSYTKDQIVIRGAAKRAGLTDYRDAEINAVYLDLIRNGYKLLAEAKEEKIKAEADIASQAK